MIIITIRTAGDVTGCSVHAPASLAECCSQTHATAGWLEQLKICQADLLQSCMSHELPSWQRWLAAQSYRYNVQPHL
jgi:hypothetical protein